MSTLTPTNNPVTAGPIEQHFDGSAELIDFTQLNDLANAFFRSLPGATVPASPTHVVDLSPGERPILEQAPSLGSPAAASPHTVSLAAAAPAEYAASLPQVENTEPRNQLHIDAVLHTSYYFLNQTSGAPGWPTDLGPPPEVNLITPQTQHFPGQPELNELLKQPGSKSAPNAAG